MNHKQFTLLITIVLVICVYVFADTAKLLDIQYYLGLYRQSPLLVISLFYLGFLLGTALSLPVSGTLSVISGALFGYTIALPLTLLSCACGGTLACLCSRFILHDAIQNRFSDQLAMINRGIESDGVFYVCSLRMVPVIPFWLLNLLMGLTPMSLPKFFFATLTGMVPITLVLVHFGTQLGDIQSFSLKELLSPGLILALLLLATIPLLGRGLVHLLRRFR